MFRVEKYSYSCDGGCITIASNKDVGFGLYNDMGDGEHTLYIVKASGWGPLMYDNNEDYTQYKNFLSGWKSYEVVPRLESKTPTSWKVLFYDLDDYDSDGIPLEGFHFAFYHRLVGEDGQIAVVCYQNDKTSTC